MKFDFTMLPLPNATLPMQLKHYTDKKNAAWLIKLCSKFNGVIDPGLMWKSQFYVGKPGIFQHW